MRTTACWSLALTIAALCCNAPVRAQVCIGDCDGSGRPTIDELVRGVNILLDRAALTLCPTLDTDSDGKVAVNELVRAVADILNGCGTIPIPTSTPTVVATPSGSPPATATPTQTVAAPNVAGEWREEEYQLASSTCDDGINALIESGLSELPPCVYSIAQLGGTLTLTDCSGAEIAGQVDANGVVSVDLPFGELPLEGCTIGIDAELTGNLSVSPTTLEQSAQVTFAGEGCALPPCTTVVTSRWTRL